MYQSRPAGRETDVRGRPLMALLPTHLADRAALASVITALVLVVVKFTAQALTGSVALLSSLVDSALDLGASLIAMLALRHARRPPDADHRFGHAKLEPLAALAQTGFIAASVLYLLASAVGRLVNPQPVLHAGIGIAAMLLSVVVTGALLLYQRHVLRRTGSMVIRADSLHYASDLAANVAVLLAIVLAGHFGMTRVDAVIALLIAAALAWGTLDLIREAVDQLMDRELPDAVRENIRQAVIAVDGVQRLRAMRTRAAGNARFAELAVELDADLPLHQAHAIAHAVEAAVRQVLPGADVTVHQEPVGSHARPAGAQPPAGASRPATPLER